MCALVSCSSGFSITQISIDLVYAFHCFKQGLKWICGLFFPSWWNGDTHIHSFGTCINKMATEWTECIHTQNYYWWCYSEVNLHYFQHFYQFAFSFFFNSEHWCLITNRIIDCVENITAAGTWLMGMAHLRLNIEAKQMLLPSKHPQLKLTRNIQAKGICWATCCDECMCSASSVFILWIIVAQNITSQWYVSGYSTPTSWSGSSNFHLLCKIVSHQAFRSGRTCYSYECH